MADTGRGPMSPGLGAARRATAAYFTLYGFEVGMWAIHIPEIRDRTQVTLHDLGILLLIFGLSSFVAMTVCGRIIDRTGSRAILVAAGIAVSVTVVGPAFAQTSTQLAVALIAYGFANGFQDAAQNAQAVEVEQAYGRPIMSAFHAYFSIGGIAAAVGGGALLGTGGDIRAVFVGSGTIGVLTAVICARYLLPHTFHKEDLRPVKGAWNARVLLVGSVAFALLLAEGVASNWSTIQLRDVLGADKFVATFGFGAFSVAMVSVRLLADRAIAKVGSSTYMRFGTLIGMAGVGLAAGSPNVPLAIVGWGLFGVGLAGCVPQVFTAAGRIDPTYSGASVARVATIGYVGNLSGPGIVGFLAPHVGLRGALFVPVVCCLYAFFVSPMAMRQANQHNSLENPPLVGDT